MGRIGDYDMNNENPPPLRSKNDTHDSPSNIAPQNELIDALNILLEAERAGTRVAISTGKDVQSDDLKQFLGLLKRDEAHWCDMLTHNIEKLDGIASLHCGDFYDKAMAIDDVLERLTFLNRGQDWVVRKLDDLMPRVVDADLHADLEKMRDSHLVNIAETTRIIEAAR